MIDPTEFLNLFAGKHRFVNSGKLWIDHTYPYSVAKPTLEQINKSKQDIFFVPNEVQGGRLDVNVQRIRAVWIDDDGPLKNGGLTDPGLFPIPPNIVVNTSPGKFHYYWLTTTDNIEEWSGVERYLANKYHGDPASTNPSRILRLPGYINTKKEYDSPMVSYSILSKIPYTWADIIHAFPPEEANVDITYVYEPKQTPVSDIKALVEGEDFHKHRMRMFVRYARVNVPMLEAIEIVNGAITSYLKSNPHDRARVFERMGNMEQCAKDAYRYINNQTPPVFSPDVEVYDGKNYTSLEYPPGALNHIVKSIEDMMKLESKEMAIGLAMHIMSTYGGGLYRIYDKTVSRKRVILAPSGRGKQIISQYPSVLIRELERPNNKGIPLAPGASSFQGSDSFTPINVHAEIGEHRIKSYSISEIGKRFLSGSGDTIGVRRYFLDALSSPYNGILKCPRLSIANSHNVKINEDLRDLYGSCLVVIGESVPEPYAEFLSQSDSYRDGTVGREEIFFIDPTRPKVNRHAGVHCISESVLRMFSKLIAKHYSFPTSGYELGNSDSFEMIDTSQIESLLDESESHSRDLINEATSNEDYIREAMYNRYDEKVLVTVLILAIADSVHLAVSTGLTEIPTPVATKAHFEYSVSYHQELIRATIHQANIGVLSTEREHLIQKIIAAAVSFGKYSRDKSLCPGTNFKSRIVSRGWITGVLGKRLSKYAAKKGGNDAVYRDILPHFVDIGLFIPQNNGQSSIKTWKLNCKGFKK